MSRDIPAPLETAIDQPVVRPFLAIKIALPDPVYAWTGVGNLSFADDGGVTRTWIGAGKIGALDTIGEATDGSATGIRVALFEAPSEFRADIADQATRGALMELYVGALNTDFLTVTSVALLGKWRVDQYKITDAGATISVEITGESRSIDQRRPAIKRFSDEYQQRKHSGDKFFEYVPKMTEVSILWAKAEQSASGVTYGTGRGSGTPLGQLF